MSGNKSGKFNAISNILEWLTKGTWTRECRDIHGIEVALDARAAIIFAAAMKIKIPTNQRERMKESFEHDIRRAFGGNEVNIMHFKDHSLFYSDAIAAMNQGRHRRRSERSSARTRYPGRIAPGSNGAHAQQ